MSDAVSLATMTGPMMAAAFKFLFDRASTFLDRRNATKDNVEDGAEGASGTAVERESVENLRRAMNALEVYDEHGLPLRSDDAKLVGHLETVLGELQRIEGRPIDIAAVARAGVAVEVESDDVEGTVTGLVAEEIGETGRADVRVRTRTVKAGGEVTGMRIERRLG
ncbi:hypothetical protein AB0J40_08180 [Amycolatopsis sp. NPDC049691]|uniref:hypothetical protein n=1 Tax=Amycolatopsis sp. NPDC049691 TaxID=3155155 RepID=UPI00341848C7